MSDGIDDGVLRSHYGDVVRGSSEMREERRIVTVLFADIVGSTSIAERFDAEDVRDVFGGAIALVVEQVDALGGTIKDLAGDGVLALFGAPTAHEDDAERAVLCGLRITETIAERASDIAADWGIDDFSIRVGIETGRAVLGPVGGGSRVEYGATGDAVNTAARLQACAEPGTVLVGALTRDMVANRFTWSDVRSFELKGKHAPVEAAFAVSYAPRRHDDRAARASTPLVGRADEMRCVATALEQVRGGQGAILGIVGEAGVGKSRIVAEARKRFASAGDPLWLEAGAASYATSIPYGLYRSLLLRWLDLDPDARKTEVNTVVDARTEVLFATQGEHLRTLIPILTGDPEEGVDPAVAQEQMFRATRRLLDALASEGPVAVVLEDLHWSDPTSLALTEHLADLTLKKPLLLLLSTRPDSDAAELLDRLADHAADRMVRLSLQALSREEDRALLHALTGGAQLPRSLVEHVLDTTDGSPFFVEEQVRALFDSGALERIGRAVRFVVGSERVLAPTVERALLARIDRLASSERRTLLAAAVVGMRFEPSLIAAIVEADCVQSLHELEQADFITTEPNVEGRQVYRFRHALMQEAAYSNLLKRQRRELHGRAAAALESLYSGREHEIAATLGRQLAEAGEADRAVGYLHTAARRAAATYANEEAASLARDGLALLVDADNGTGITYRDRSIAADLSRIEGAATRALARYDEAVVAFRRALDLLPIEEAVDRARVMSIVGQILSDAHQYSDALDELEAAARLIGEAPRTDEAFDVWIDILRATSSTLYWIGDDERHAELLQRAERHAELLQRAEPLVQQRATPRQKIVFFEATRNAALRRDRFVLSDKMMQLDLMIYEANRKSEDEEVRAWAAFMRGFAHLWRRELDDAEPLLRESLASAERLGSAMLRARALTYLMVSARFRGDIETAAASVDPVRQAARTADLPEYQAIAGATAAWIAYRRDDQVTVRTEAPQALEIWAALPNLYPFAWMSCFPLLAVAVSARDADEAARWAEMMIATSQQRLPAELEATLRVALDATSRERPTEALEHFNLSLTIATRLAYL